MTYVDIAAEFGCTAPCARYWCDDMARAENHQRMSVNSTGRTTERMQVVHHDKEIITALYAFVIQYNEQHGTDYEVDHIIPAFKGGVHEITNLRILPRKMNRTGRPKKKE